ncbi:CotO family spore coat protein [Ornithinibacillus gellani]|uniref:CotO family spore coat protein n=1 Tax=Ornithinibacillus gellani TaxID=2293253 RepID=UPI001680C9E7|nr:CotO family spore coat protein [Ornithinibacillus gellani]
MENSHGYAREPMLYIHQPTLKVPEAKMQQHYRSYGRGNETLAVEDKTTVQESVEREKRPVRRSPKKNVLSIPQDRIKDKVDKDISENEGMTQKEKQSRPKFKDMKLLEKIAYLAEKPTHVPKMKCELKTAERNYRGIIMELKDEVVHMQVVRKPGITAIPITSVTDVRMLGF